MTIATKQKRANDHAAQVNERPRKEKHQGVKFHCYNPDPPFVRGPGYIPEDIEKWLRLREVAA